MCYWYKQAIGQKTVKITSYNKLGLKKDLSKVDPRFTLNNTDNYNNLKIKDLHFSDAATYFCMSSNLYNVDFLEAITLDVEGAGFHFTTSVFELMPENSGIRSSATMDGCFDNGIFSGEHGVYWFSPSKESGKGVLYSHGGNTDQGESNTDSSTNSCIYNLPILMATQPEIGQHNEEDIHYAALMHHSSNRATRQADSNNTEYVYSSVRL
ncbi:uncharacterized protein [Eucyclogobius newberryi]|uniref:uncharacterized protein n=1 Tax=Eucyclogobius newberryi TaxID=166745 RepID=UPI003B5B3F36